MNRFFLCSLLLCYNSCYTQHPQIKHWDTFWIDNMENLPAKIHVIDDNETDDFVISLFEDGLKEWNYNLEGKYFDEQIDVVSPTEQKDCNSIYVEFKSKEEMPDDKAGLITTIGNCYLYVTLLDSYRGFGHYEHLYCTFMHELGHSLGLEHNPDKDSYMYKKAGTNREILQEDIDEIHNRYPKGLLENE